MIHTLNCLLWHSFAHQTSLSLHRRPGLFNESPEDTTKTSWKSTRLYKGSTQCFIPQHETCCCFHAQKKRKKTHQRVRERNLFYVGIASRCVCVGTCGGACYDVTDFETLTCIQRQTFLVACATNYFSQRGERKLSFLGKDILQNIFDERTSWINL